MAKRAPLYIAVGLFIALAFRDSNQIAADFKPNLRYGIATALLIVVSLLNMSNVKGFLYFQF